MIGYRTNGSGEQTCVFRLAFKLYCFHFAMGYPAFKSLLKSGRLGFASIFIPHTTLGQNKVAGFLEGLQSTLSPEPRSGGVESAFP